MTDPTKNKQDDEIIASLYQHGSVEQPSDELDKKILNAARNKSDNVIGWPAKKIINTLLSSHSLAVAAVLVLSISIILQIQFDHPEELMSPTTEQQLSHSAPANNIPEKQADIQQSMTDIPPQMSSQSVEEVLSKSKPKAPVKDLKKSARHSAALKEKALAKKQQIEYKQQREQERRQHIEKQRLSERKKLKRKAKRQYSESQQLSAIISSPSSDSPADSIASITDQPCSELSNSKCLESTSCILDKADDTLICREPNNKCEQDFVQIAQSKEQCQMKSECEFISSDCHCDEHGCQCEDNLPPACKPIFDDEDNTD